MQLGAQVQGRGECVQHFAWGDSRCKCVWDPRQGVHMCITVVFVCIGVHRFGASLHAAYSTLE